MSRRKGVRAQGRVRSGDWECACGQSYRVLTADGVLWMWPTNSTEPIGAECVCGLPISRNTVLSGLFGASVLGVGSPA